MKLAGRRVGCRGVAGHRGRHRRRPLTVRPVTADRFGDLEQLFGPNGAVQGCWCMYWRRPGKDWSDNTENHRRLALRVAEAPPPGLLGYLDGRPVGWVQVGPRTEFERLERSRNLGPVDGTPAWCVNCFFIARQARARAWPARLLGGAIELARSYGATVLEGYPVDRAGASSGDLYTGTMGLFTRSASRRWRAATPAARSCASTSEPSGLSGSGGVQSSPATSSADESTMRGGRPRRASRVAVACSPARRSSSAVRCCHDASRRGSSRPSSTASRTAQSGSASWRQSAKRHCSASVGDVVEGPGQAGAGPPSLHEGHGPQPGRVDEQAAVVEQHQLRRPSWCGGPSGRRPAPRRCAGRRRRPARSRASTCPPPTARGAPRCGARPCSAWRWSIPSPVSGRSPRGRARPGPIASTSATAAASVAGRPRDRPCSAPPPGEAPLSKASTSSRSSRRVFGRVGERVHQEDGVDVGRQDLGRARRRPTGGRGRCGGAAPRRLGRARRRPPPSRRRRPRYPGPACRRRSSPAASSTVAQPRSTRAARPTGVGRPAATHSVVEPVVPAQRGRAAVGHRRRP